MKIGRFWLLMIGACLVALGMAWQSSRFADLAARADETSLFSDLGLEEMERVVEIVAHFNNCKTITLPLSPVERRMETTGVLWFCNC